MPKTDSAPLWFTLDTVNTAQWLRPGSPPAAGSLAQLGVACESAREVVWLLDGREVSCFEAELPPASAKIQAQVLPFAMEEQVLGSVEALLFASIRLPGGRHGVAVTERAALEAQFAALLAAGVAVTAIVPDVLLLPWHEGEWTLLVLGERAWLRCGQALGFAFEASAWPAFLAQASAGLPPPQRVRGIGVAGDRVEVAGVVPDGEPPPRSFLEGVLGSETIQAASPRALRRWPPSFGEAAPQGATDPAGRPLPDFAPLVGSGRPAQAFRVHARQWGWVAGLVFGGLLAHGTFLQWQASNLEQQVSAERTANEALLRERFPEISRIVDVRAQAIQAQASRQGGSAGGQGFLDRLARVGPVLLAAGQGAELATLEFDHDALDLRVELPDMAAVDGLQRALQAGAITASTLSVETAEHGVRLSLRIGDAP